jgi:MFS family permease
MTIDRQVHVQPGDEPEGRLSRLLVHFPRTGPLRSLRHAPFLIFWLSFFVSQIGFWMSNVTLQWMTARLTDNDPFSMGLLFFFNLVPLLLFSPWAGVMADRWVRTTVVALSQAAIALLCLVLMAYLILSGSEPRLELIFGFAFLLGTMLAISAPAGQAVVANTVPQSDLPSAIGLQSISLNIARVAGPGAATPMLVVWGARPIFGIYAATSLFTAWSVGRLRVQSAPIVTTGARTWLRVLEGLKHVSERPPAGIALAMVAATSIFGASYVSQLAVFAYDVLKGDDVTFGVLIVATGVGAVGGALATTWRETSPSIQFVAFQMIAMAATLVAFAYAGHLIVVALLAMLVAGLNFSVMTTLNIILQNVIEEHSRGRVMSLYILAWGGLIPIGSLALGSVAGFWNVQSAVTVFALVQVLIACLVIATRRTGDQGVHS